MGCRPKDRWTDGRILHISMNGLQTVRWTNGRMEGQTDASKKGKKEALCMKRHHNHYYCALFKWYPF